MVLKEITKYLNFQNIIIYFIVLFFVFSIIDFKELDKFTSSFKMREGYENKLKTELNKYRPVGNTAQNNADSIKKYNLYIDDYANAMVGNGWAEGATNSGEPVNGLNLTTNSKGFSDINQSMRNAVGANILTLILNGSLNPHKPKGMVETVKKINSLYKFRQNSIQNNTNFISNTGKEGVISKLF